jgi:endoglucanase Acf2
MKLFKNKSVILLIIAIFAGTYIAVSIIPQVYRNSISGNTTDIFKKYSRIDSSQLDLTGLEILTRSEKVYYNQDGAVPTNKIWNSAIFKGQLTGLYTLPFASNTSEGTLNVTIPKKYVYEKLISSQIISEFISIKGRNELDKVYVESFSDLTVNLSFLDKSGSEVFKATFVQGSPYIYIFPVQDTINISSEFFKLKSTQNNWIYGYENTSLGIFSNGSTSQFDNNLSIKFTPSANNYLTIALVDDNNFDLIKSYAENFISSINTSFEILDSRVNTTYTFTYRNGSETIFGLLPNHYMNAGFDTSSMLFAKNTIRGDQRFVKTSEKITFSVERIPVLDNLPAISLSPEEKQKLIDLIEKDLRDIVFVRPSVYFGGNDLLKLAQLLEVSNQLENSDLVSRISMKLKEELENWFTYKDGETGKYFVFDETWGGIIGYETAGFGGENYNDHHFQYGYFILSSAILAKYDPQFLAEYGDFVNKLVLDIANIYPENKVFPYLRYFDSYEGHSWATGFADFTDGSNQESTSEAINAWYAVNQWSRIIGNAELTKFSEYLYSHEINAARNYWLNWYNNKAIFPDEYGYNKGSNLFGGKVEYQTWFSLEPQSIEGIQYLPITPGSTYLYNREIINRDYTSFKANLDDINAHLVDFNYLYYAMINGFEVLPEDIINQMRIDEGQSRGFMYYWTFFWDDVVDVKIENTNGKPEYVFEIR